MLLLFLLVFPPAWAWRCPNITVEQVHCHCEIPHTLRCDGSVGPAGGRSPVLRRLVRAVSALGAEEAVTLLDLSVQNLARLQGRLFQGAGQLAGLVISSGSLATIDTKAFSGLGGTVRALGLPSNQLGAVPVAALEQLGLLTRLDLSGNKIRHIDTMPRLPELEYLDLSRNNLSRVAGGWTQATPNLRTLLLAGNTLTIDSLAQHSPRHLTYLTHLSLARNKVSGLLAAAAVSLLCPAGVKTLDLSWNLVTGVRTRAFSGLPALATLSLQGNAVQRVEEGAFSGLRSLSSLDLSHNQIVALGPGSLAGMPRLQHLALAHNYLQAVSGAWLRPLPSLETLLVMDNDISLVEEGSLDTLTNLTEINLAGNLLTCDCHVSYLYTWLGRVSAQLSNTSARSAVCATPPHLTNAPVALLAASPSCEAGAEQEAEYYYEYYHYHDNTTASPANTSVDTLFLATKEVHFEDWRYDEAGQRLLLTWRLEAGVRPYTCDLVQVIEETEAGPRLRNSNISCEVTREEGERVTVGVDLARHGLGPDTRYIYCLTLLHRGHVVPGCSGPLVARDTAPRVQITGLRGNVSVTRNMTVTVTSRAPAPVLGSCAVRVTVAAPGEAPEWEGSYGCAASGGEHCDVTARVADLPRHSFYNVCAELSAGPGQLRVVDSQCMILHTSTIVRYQTRSVLSLLLTLIFLSLGIACLTVLYLILRRRGRTRAAPGPGSRACASLGYALSSWWRLARYKQNQLVTEDGSEDEGD